MDDLLGGIILLSLAVVVALAYLVTEAVLWFVITYHEEILSVIVAALVLVGKAHLAVGAGIAWVVRDLPVRLFNWSVVSDRVLRSIIVLWLVVVPVALFGGLCFIAGMLGWAWWGFSAGGVLVFVPSSVLIVAGYYHHYFERPVFHHHWPQFMAQYRLMSFELQTAFAFRWGQLQLLWNEWRWAQVQG